MSPLDRAAHQSRWRHRSLVEKGVLTGGMLGLALLLPPLPGAMIVWTMMTMVTLIGAGVPARVWMVAMAGPLGFVLTGAASLLFQIDGGGLSLAPGGALAATGLVARSMAALACLLFLGLTTPTTDLLQGLRRVGLPAEVTELALLMYRFLFLLADTASTMHQAQAARLGHSTRRRRLRSLGLLIANLLPSALDRARRLEIGLAARGWQGEMRVLGTRPRVSPSGLASVIVLEALTAALGVLL